MSIRTYMNNNPAVITIAAIVLLLICLGVIYNTLSGGGRPQSITEMYFYDMGSGEVFVAPVESLAPIDAPSGPYHGQPGGVRAYVFSCSDCDDVSSRQVAYLEMYTPEARAALAKSRDAGPDAGGGDFMYYETGRLIKATDSDKWVRANSPEATSVYDAVSNLCLGERAIPCYPGR